MMTFKAKEYDYSIHEPKWKVHFQNISQLHTNLSSEFQELSFDHNVTKQKIESMMKHHDNHYIMSGTSASVTVVIVVVLTVVYCLKKFFNKSIWK